MPKISDLLDAATIAGNELVYLLQSGQDRRVTVANLISGLAGVGLGRVTTSDTAPAGAADGDLWWDSVGCQLYVWYDDGTSQQWVPATSINAAITTATMASWFAALPTTPPSTSGQPWNNSGTLSFTF